MKGYLCKGSSDDGAWVGGKLQTEIFRGIRSEVQRLDEQGMTKLSEETAEHIPKMPEAGFIRALAV